MKKLIAIIAALSILMTLCSCDTGGDETALYDKGLEITSIMDEMLDSEDYLSMLGLPQAASELAEEIAAEDRSTPKTVYSVTLSMENINSNIPVGTSERIVKKIHDTAASSSISAVNSYQGADYAVLAAATSHSTTFVNRSLKDSVIYIYIYENATPVAIVFCVGDGGAVSATGMLLFRELSSEDDIKNIFGMYNPTVEKIK